MELYATDRVAEAAERHRDWIAEEVLALGWELVASPGPGFSPLGVDDASARLERVS